MSIIEKLKAESMKLRKDRDPLAPKLVFALSEIDKVGKNAGNRQTTDDEAIKVIQKIISTIDQTVELLSPNSPVVYDLHREKGILESVLPQMASVEQIREAMQTTFDAQTPPSKGDVMKWAKTRWGALANMTQVSVIASELYWD